MSTMSTRNIQKFWLKCFKVLKIAYNYGWSCSMGWNGALSVVRTQIIIFNLLKFRSSLHTCKKLGRLHGSVSQHLVIRFARRLGQSSGRGGLSPCLITCKSSVILYSVCGNGMFPVRISAQVIAKLYTSALSG